MLQYLLEAEKELPFLLKRPSLWQSLFINYEKPFVERLWCPWKKYRLNLHKIHPCLPGESFFHPHPWASAMKIVEGTYRMAVGYGEGLIEPPVATVCYLTPGSIYEMLDINAWHSVAPIDEPVYSIMLTDVPWNRSMPKSEKIRLSSLSDEKLSHLTKFFSDKYL